MAQRPLLIRHPSQQAVFHEAAEVRGEDVPPNAERRAEVVEAARPHAGLTDDQEVPTVAEDMRAARHRAGPRRCVGPTHEINPTGSVTELSATVSSVTKPTIQARDAQLFPVRLERTKTTVMAHAADAAKGTI